MAAAVQPVQAGTGRASDWQKKYPPLIALVVALIIAIVVLPSSLNVQQPNPSQTLEYAPVPPKDDTPPPPQGNFSNLGLGQSQGIASATTIPAALPPPGKGVNPSTKRCVGNPPRQTEDPLSPPCVAFFNGDNFGATYAGVTGEEIRLVFYFDGNIQELGCSGGTCPRPNGVIYDLFEPENPDDADNENSKHLLVKAMRVWQRYFNERFQTYGRVVHFYVAFGPSSQPPSPEERRADAAEIYQKVKPFALISDAGDNQDALLQAMAQKEVLNFGALFGRPKSFYDQYPKLIWGYLPSIEQQSDQYASYVCQKVQPHPSALNGNSDSDPGPDTGEPRKIGIIQTSDEGYPNLLAFADRVREKIADCGVQVEATSAFPHCCYAKDNSITHEYANFDMAEFQQKGITTILWLGGANGYYGPAAEALGYQPEWILLGDSQLEGNNPPRLMSANNVWDGRAIVITPQVYEPALQQQLCYLAFREIDQTYPESDLGFACDPYQNLFQFFTGVQVAGPRLGPTSIDKGFHAIPEIRSENPAVPACFYFPGDYTCVKDAQAEIWDAQGAAPGDSRPGCWRSIEGGKRYLPNEWPEGNITAQLRGDEPCNGYSAGVLIDPT
ncbi:MAG TPA: hypothetical protein VFU93_05395 [Acidimicrobiales bacterium]|nr:hypothetical protein [Acidimicrobiales bacterium]